MTVALPLRTPRSPIELIQALGLIGEGPAQQTLSPERLDALLQRRAGFDWLHLGQTTIPIGHLLDVIQSDPCLLPPRTGHLGNWEAIARCQAGAPDFNWAAGAEGLGYPLIYGFNQTENEALDQGDVVYLPGSLVEEGQRSPCRLHTWDGQRFVERDRSSSLFTPLVKAAVGDELLPLTRLHRQRMERLSRFNFVMEADALLAHEDRLRRILEACVEDAAAQPNPRIALQSVFDRQVDLAGIVSRQDIARHGLGWQMGPHYYAGTGELVEAALLPFRAVAQPEAFFSAMPRHPAYLPVVAAPAVQLIAAFLGTHYPRCLDTSCRTNCSFNPHFHWGARDMAGYPPVQNGYFARSSRAKMARRTADMLVRRFPDLDPVLFVLIPASIFMLCPNAASEGDSEAVATLIAKVRDRAGTLPAEEAMPGVSDLVSRWLATGPSVSPYFLRRFLPRSGVGHGAPLPPPSTLVRPEGFTSLSLRQACMTVAALMEQVPTLQDGRHG